MRDMLEARKQGDTAFRDKDFKTAIDYYSQVWSFIYCSSMNNKMMKLNMEFEVKGYFMGG